MFNQNLTKNKKLNSTKKTITAILAIVMLSTLTLLPIARASHDYNNGMHSSNMYTTNWLQYYPNAQCTATAFNNIDNLFTQQVIHQMFLNIHIYDEVQNNGAVSPQTVYDRIDHDNTYHTYNYVLYVGHGGPNGFYGYTSSPSDPYTTPALTSFSTIQSHTQVSPSYRLAFMWVCNGKGNGAAGSPTAWNPQYWNNPYTDPYTWIGFSGASPWLYETISSGNLYEHWLVFFYYFTLNGYSVQTALNEAAKQVGFQNFANTPLASGTYSTYWPYQPTIGWYSGQMHVMGNPTGTYLPSV